MRYIRIGSQEVSVVGLGAWQFGSNAWGWGADFGPDQAKKIVERAMELGINLIDTAELYGKGQSEEYIGEFIRGRRSEIFLATKVSPHHLLRASVHKAAERSLKRLQTDYLDLYQVHFPNPLIPHSWTMKAMQELQATGIIRNVGVSNYGHRRWQRAEQALGTPIVANQLRYHLLDRSIEEETLPYAVANNKAIIAYSPLAQGLFSGNYRPGSAPRGVRLINPLFTPPNMHRALPLIQTLEEIGKNHGATPAQISLAWLLRHDNVIVIPGAKSIAQIEANARAADIVLTEGEIELLTQISDSIEGLRTFGSIPQLLRRFIFS